MKSTLTTTTTTTTLLGSTGTESEVREWLQSVKLEMYTEKILQQGFDVLNEIMNLPKDELDEMINDIGIKPNHAKRFRKAIAKYKELSESKEDAWVNHVRFSGIQYSNAVADEDMQIWTDQDYTPKDMPVHLCGKQIYSITYTIPQTEFTISSSRGDVWVYVGVWKESKTFKAKKLITSLKQDGWEELESWFLTWRAGDRDNTLVFYYKKVEGGTKGISFSTPDPRTTICIIISDCKPGRNTESCLRIMNYKTKQWAPYNIILVGNPGVGKSTIASSILGTSGEFQSGLSAGAGFTKKLHWRDIPTTKGGFTNKIADTPGLADTKLRKQAAEAIDAALITPTTQDADGKAYCVTTINFVCTEEGCRVRPGDIVTIKAVLEGIDGGGLDRKGYNLMVNKITEKRKAFIIKNKGNFLAPFVEIGRIPLTVSFSLMDKDALDENNAILRGNVFMYTGDLKEEIVTGISFKQWAKLAWRIKYECQRVNPIVYDEVKEKQKEMEELLQRLKDDKAKHEKAILESNKYVESTMNDHVQSGSEGGCVIL